MISRNKLVITFSTSDSLHYTNGNAEGDKYKRTLINNWNTKYVFVTSYPVVHTECYVQLGLLFVGCDSHSSCVFLPA